MKKIKTLFSALCVLGALSACASAEDLTISASFRPSAHNPDYDNFKNDTPQSGHCATYPCASGRFSILTGLMVNNRVIDSTNLADKRLHSYQKVRSEWREVHLFHRESGRWVTVEFRLNLLAQRFFRPEVSWATSDFQGASANPEGACSGNNGAVSTNVYHLAWSHPEASSSVCTKNILNIVRNDVTIDRISIGYQLRSPSPMTMPNGTFRGSIEYSVGRGMDIDLGEGDYSDNVLRINIEATIEHELRVGTLGNTRISLQPPGGWDNWNHGGAPDFKLSGRGNFTVVASSPLSLSVECTHSVLNTCALQKDGSTEKVPVLVNLTIPGMRIRETGGDVVDTFIPLYRGGVVGTVIEPVSYVNTIGSVDFTVGEPASALMVEHLGSTWRGAATLIFDSELPFIPGA
ncbi:hypothetical protein [Scandinavium sp.]|uniref:hypothetical protein n=1 Tax=Scandinavium sp. TaxID=2830653 RepID=UPI00289B37C7|nr:hypothetical protein [Scandinavium sp.]